MKTKFCLILGAALLALLAGCASAGPALVLAPVGPAPRAGSPQGSRGALVVYSAFNTGVPNPSLPDDFRPHTDYELRAEDGKLLQRIANQAAARSEDPATLPLVPGRYRVVARANGYGRVTVPVVIVANRITEVHLDGGSPPTGAFFRKHHCAPAGRGSRRVAGDRGEYRGRQSIGRPFFCDPLWDRSV